MANRTMGSDTVPVVKKSASNDKLTKLSSKKRTMKKRMDVSGHSECTASCSESEELSSEFQKQQDQPQSQAAAPVKKQSKSKTTGKSSTRPKRTTRSPRRTNSGPELQTTTKRSSAPASQLSSNMPRHSRSNRLAKSCTGPTRSPSLALLTGLPNSSSNHSLKDSSNNDGPDFQRRDTLTSMVPNPGTKVTNGLKVTFGGERARIIEEDKCPLSVKWYSKEDLKMLLDHEMSIAQRALERSQKSLHCCWRGLEHIQQCVDKAEHVTQHVLSVLVIHHDLKKQVESGKVLKKSPEEMLRLRSKQMTKEDRKLAYKNGIQDASEATAQDVHVVIAEVQAQHATMWALLEKATRRSAPRGEKSKRGMRSLAAHSVSPEKSRRGARSYSINKVLPKLVK